MNTNLEIPPLPSGFELDLNKTAANAHSGHNVVFGKYQDYDVALKPFTGADGRTMHELRNKAGHEKRMYEIVGKLGFLTAQPLQIVEEDGIAYLLTSYIPNLMAGSSFDLTRPLEDSTRGKSVVDVVSSIMSANGELHRHSITHGDSKTRNFSFNRLDSEQEPHVMDLEGAQLHSTSSTDGRLYFDNARRNDLRSISYNLGQLGLGGSSKRSEVHDIFSDIMITPYVMACDARDPIPRSAIDSALGAFHNGIQKFNVAGKQ